MPDTELVSRSLLLLQYRLALDMMAEDDGALEHGRKASEARGVCASCPPNYDL